MKRFQSRTVLALVTAGAVFAASPALAFNWLCIAKDRQGTEYEGRSFGLSNDGVKNRAGEKAMAKCEAGDGTSCKIKECIDLDAQYSQ